MGKFSRAWSLTKQSFAVLRSDKQLVMFPLLSSAACLLVLASFAVPMVFAVDWSAAMKSAEQGGSHGGRAEFQMQPWYYLVLFAFYFVNFFVITFFNSALVACAINRFNGQPSGLRDGLAVAASRLPQILAWAGVAATVGVILQAVQERLGFVGRFVLNLIGMVWTVATFFVVPVLVVEKVGPFDAIKRSVLILKKTWGESLVANLGLGAVSMVLTLAGVLMVVAGIVGTVMLESAWPVIVGGVLTVIWLIGLALVMSTLKMILLAATYQYAATGQVPSGFDSGLLQEAFRTKGAK